MIDEWETSYIALDKEVNDWSTWYNNEYFETSVVSVTTKISLRSSSGESLTKALPTEHPRLADFRPWRLG